MKISYHETDDILRIELKMGKIVRDVSMNWNVTIGYTDSWVGEITILDARQAGLFAMVLEGCCIPCDYVPSRKATRDYLNQGEADADN